jgi:hypothetical protein
VDDAFFLGLAGVEGLNGVDDLVAHDAGAVDGLRPVLLRERADGPPVPFTGSGRCAAPVAFANVQYVVLEILETRPGAPSREVTRRWRKGCATVGVVALHMLEREHLMRWWLDRHTESRTSR